MDNKRWFTTAEAAAYLSVAVHAVRDAVWSGHLPYVRAGKRFIFDRTDLDGWAEARKVREPGLS
ncbi:MAG TPA: helix-turn-helix domain-containing protein [Candidatus Dormibacteraeota bacterium]|nr:helix-turn-helix domain-containing protein [Candidatus Dormibacteraeota bacterium]